MSVRKSFIPVHARCSVEIRGGSIYIHRDNVNNLIAPRIIDLSAQSTLQIKGQILTVRQILDAIIDYDESWLLQWFDERGQLEVGLFLYKALFGTHTPDEIIGGAPQCEVRIVTDDEDLDRLPWALLAHGGVFLATAGWSVALSSSGEKLDCELPPCPKLLIAAPEPNGWPQTQATEHLVELQDRLSKSDASYNGKDSFRVVRSWQAFRVELSNFKPDLIYYYGHGVGNINSSRLVFADEGGSEHQISMADLATEIRNRLELQLCAIYINCCQGDVGGLLGAGRQMVNVVPAVLTNRTTAFVDVARAQAIAFWDDLIVRGLSPQSAAGRLYGGLGNLNLTLTDYRWMTPVLYCRYGDWRANPPPVLSRDERDPDWKFKLDRVSQFSRVFFQTHQMIFERKPKGMIYLWFGAPNQGLEIFHERLNRELQEKLNDVQLYQVSPEWPEELNDPARSYSDMYTQAFQVQDLDQVPGRIRAYSRQRTGQRTLVYLRHTPVFERATFDPNNLPHYLQWWSKYIVPRLPENCHALMGISFAATNPGKFHDHLIKKLMLDKLDLGNAVLVILDGLERVTLHDLRDFIRTHNIPLPNDIQDRILEKLLAETDGSYEHIIEEMKHLESRVWRESVEGRKVNDTDEDEDMGMP